MSDKNNVKEMIRDAVRESVKIDPPPLTKVSMYYSRDEYLIDMDKMSKRGMLPIRICDMNGVIFVAYARFASIEDFWDIREN